MATCLSRLITLKHSINYFLTFFDFLRYKKSDLLSLSFYHHHNNFSSTNIRNFIIYSRSAQWKRSFPRTQYLTSVQKTKSSLDNIAEEFDAKQDAVEQIIGHVRSIMEGELNLGDIELFGELGELARYINETKKSLKSLSNLDITEKELPETSDQLEGILQSTEEATDQILTLAEGLLSENSTIVKKIEQLREAAKVNAQANTEDLLNELEQLNKNNYDKFIAIMTACNFQDLTGQRIQKIVTMVRDIEKKIMTMVIGFDLKIKSKENDADQEKIEKEQKLLEQYQEPDLLKGPQKKGVAVEQNEVYDLLADLGF